ncbi:MAG: hypothetical protein ACI8QD_001538 [Cyclobacteriaceae bacterium]|jgi:hypothetical protein
MFELFSMGGPLFMGVLTLIFVAMIAVALINGLPVLKGEVQDPSVASRKISYVRSVGLFALIIGIFGQLIGLFGAFQAIEQMGSVMPALLVGGLKVSMITTLYGLLIYLISFLIWFGLSVKLKS